MCQTDDLHAVVVRGEMVLEGALTVSSGHGGSVVVQHGISLVPSEVALADVTLPAHGVAMTQTLFYAGDERIQRHVQELTMVAVVRELQGKALVVRMMRETGQRHILVIGADAMGKLQWRIPRTEHEHLTG